MLPYVTLEADIFFKNEMFHKMFIVYVKEIFFPFGTFLWLNNCLLDSKGVL